MGGEAAQDRRWRCRRDDCWTEPGVAASAGASLRNWRWLGVALNMKSLNPKTQNRRPTLIRVSPKPGLQGTKTHNFKDPNPPRTPAFSAAADFLIRVLGVGVCSKVKLVSKKWDDKYISVDALILALAKDWVSYAGSREDDVPQVFRDSTRYVGM